MPRVQALFQLVSFWTCTMSVAVCVSHARADAMLPDGTTVPRDSGNSEIKLPAFFTAQAEAIDWQADAHTTPDTFSPLCDFTATLLLKQSGSTNIGVGWYNVIAGATTAPPVTDIFEVVPAGSLVGTTITGATIRGDARYLGGLVGFALIRPGKPAHFTESKWNTQCTLCATPGPWLLSLTYKSVNTPNTFYVAFEDGDTTAAGWSNDGDYNDYVFRFTGLQCAGAGEPCMVDAAKGACVDGLTECDDTGMLTCKMLVAARDEACDGVDNDCDGDADDGEMLCPVGKQCVRGTCVPPCGEEFPCAGDDVCEAGQCVNPKCVGKTCDAGEACIDGACRAPCEDVKCPGAQVCRSGRCMDPCTDVTCGEGDVCSGGVCVLSCTCSGCADGLACAPSGTCVEPGCDTQTCDSGKFCVVGACVDACEGAVCPRGETCSAGMCLVEADAGVPGPVVGSDSGVSTIVDSGFPGTPALLDASVDPTVEPRRNTAATGCSCRIELRRKHADRNALAMLGLALCVLHLRLRVRRVRRALTSAH